MTTTTSNRLPDPSSHRDPAVARRLARSAARVTVAFMALTALLALAQEPTSTDLPRFEDALEVGVVEIPFLARDRRGRPVTDLTVDDVVVVESGERPRILFLERRAERYDDVDLPEIRLFLDAPGGSPEPVVSDQAPPRHAVLFVDVDNDPKLGKGRAAAQLQQFATADLDSGYRIAVLSYAGETREEIGFTSDRRAVVTAIESAFGRAPRPQLDLATRVRQLVDRFRDCAEDGDVFSLTLAADESCLRSTAIEYAEERRRPAREFLRGLEGLVRYLAGLEGDKTVYAVSHGVSIDPVPEILESMKAVLGDNDAVYRELLHLGAGEGPQGELRELLEIAYRSGVTIHFVDRMLEPSADRSARLDRPYAPGTAPTKVAFEAERQALREVAETTGGVFVESLDVRQGLQEVLALEEGAYVVGFAVDGPISTARLTRIEVKSRRSGVRIEHRSAQRGRRRSIAEGAAGEGAILARAAFVPADRAAALAPEAAPTKPGREIRPFVLRIEPEQLGYRAAGDSARATFTLHARLSLADGPLLADSYHLVEHAAPAKDLREGALQPLLFVGWVEAPPGRYRLDTLVRNPRDEAEGRAVAFLEIENEATSPGSE